MNNPVVFLDIDGVLNSAEDHEMRKLNHLSNINFYSAGDFVNKIKLKRLHQFLDDIDARVVFVSSWFWGSPNTEEHIRENMYMIRFLGLEHRALGVLKYTGGGLARGKEVLKMVEALELTDWIVVDDAGSHMYDFDTHEIYGKMGLLDTDIEILKERLKNGKH